MNEIADEDIGGDLVKQDMTRECRASRVEKYHSKDFQKIIADIMNLCLQQVDRSYGDAWILWKRASLMTKRLCVARITAGDRKSDLDYDTSQYYLLLDQCLEDMSPKSEGMFYLLLCGIGPHLDCYAQHVHGPYYTAQACVWWERELNRGQYGKTPVLYECANANGEAVNANIEGCYWGPKEGGVGVVCPSPPVVRGHPDLLDGPPAPQPTQPTMHFAPRTCYDVDYHQKPCKETSPEGDGDLGP